MPQAFILIDTFSLWGRVGLQDLSSRQRLGLGLADQLCISLRSHGEAVVGCQFPWKETKLEVWLSKNGGLNMKHVDSHHIFWRMVRFKPEQSRWLDEFSFVFLSTFALTCFDLKALEKKLSNMDEVWPLQSKLISHWMWMVYQAASYCLKRRWWVSRMARTGLFSGETN